MEKIQITREGLDKIKEELDFLVKVERPRIINRIKEARELGDLSENFDYHDAKREQGEKESRIAELKFILDNAEIVEKGDSETVNIGSTVTIYMEAMDMEVEYTLVGPAESDIASGKIACDCPLGEALMGAKAGDTVEYQSPGGSMKCVVKSLK